MNPLRLGCLLATLLLPGFLPAQGKKPAAPPGPKPVVLQGKDVKGKDDRPDPGRIKERLFTVGEFCARVTEVGEEGQSLKVVVPIRLAVPNPAAVERLAGLQGEAVAALRIEDPVERLQEIQRV